MDVGRARLGRWPSRKDCDARPGDLLVTRCVCLGGEGVLAGFQKHFQIYNQEGSVKQHQWEAQESNSLRGLLGGRKGLGRSD